MSNEYAVLAGNGSAGQFVLSGQTLATDEGFRNVSKLWYDKTLPYSRGIDVLREKSADCHDILTDARGVRFSAQDNGVVVEIEGKLYTPDDYGGKKLLSWMGCGESLWAEFVHKDSDDGDYDLLARALRNGQRRMTEEKNLLFRCDGERLRFVASDSYAPVANVWFVETIAELIPGGRLSHFDFSDASTLFGNVLIPDTIRKENDSEYGAMLSLSNCEIGKRRLGSEPSLFHAICMNGNIWSQVEGVEYSRRHRGNINLAELKNALAANIQRQIPLSVAMIDKLLATQSWELSANVTTIFAAVMEECKLHRNTAMDSVEEWHKQGQKRSAFGIIDALTRAGQKQGAAEWYKADSAAGTLTASGIDNWTRLQKRANTYTDKQIQKLLAVGA